MPKVDWLVTVLAALDAGYTIDRQGFVTFISESMGQAGALSAD